MLNFLCTMQRFLCQYLRETATPTGGYFVSSIRQFIFYICLFIIYWDHATASSVMLKYLFRTPVDVGCLNIHLSSFLVESWTVELTLWSSPIMALCTMWFGGIEFSQHLPCACRKRRLIMGYKLSYTTGLLHAWSPCIIVACSFGSWALGPRSKGGWVLFIKNQWHPWEEIPSYRHSRISYSSFFFLPR